MTTQQPGRSAKSDKKLSIARPAIHLQKNLALYLIVALQPPERTKGQAQASQDQLNYLMVTSC